jgi:hypothetical protein
MGLSPTSILFLITLAGAGDGFLRAVSSRFGSTSGVALMISTCAVPQSLNHDIGTEDSENEPEKCPQTNMDASGKPAVLFLHKVKHLTKIDACHHLRCDGVQDSMQNRPSLGTVNGVGPRTTMLSLILFGHPCNESCNCAHGLVRIPHALPRIASRVQRELLA